MNKMRSTQSYLFSVSVLLYMLCISCNAAPGVGSSTVHGKLVVIGQSTLSPTHVVYTNLPTGSVRSAIRAEPGIFSEKKTVLINDKEQFSFIVTKGSLVIDNQSYSFDEGHVFTVEWDRDVLNVNQVPIMIDKSPLDIDVCKLATTDVIREFYEQVEAEMVECFD